MKLDKKDLLILGILDWKARTPINQIAKKTRLNKDVVRYRIRKLEEKGIIEGYYALLDTQKLSYLTFVIYWDLINTNKEIEESMIEFLNRNFNPGFIFSLEGEFELGIITLEKSIFDLEQHLLLFKKKFGENINQERISLHSYLNHYPRKTLPGVKNDKIVFKDPQKVELKEKDLQILKELSKNARVSTTELSQKLKIPQRTIAYRIKELEKKKVIAGYRANINHRKLGYENYFIEVYTKNGEEVKQIETYAEMHKNCIYTQRVFPGADLDIETEFANKEEFLNFIDELKEKFNSIKKIKYRYTRKYYTIKYLP